MQINKIRSNHGYVRLNGPRSTRTEEEIWQQSRQKADLSFHTSTVKFWRGKTYVCVNFRNN